jgi:hypothetical protein
LGGDGDDVGVGGAIELADEVDGGLAVAGAEGVADLDEDGLGGPEVGGGKKGGKLTGAGVVLVGLGEEGLDECSVDEEAPGGYWPASVGGGGVWLRLGVP